MTLIKHEGQLQITCNACPITYRRTYVEADFEILRQEIKADGWRIKREAAEWIHTCPDCSRWADKRLL